MGQMINKFFELLFPDGAAATCFTDSIKGTSVTPVYPHETRLKTERFCINSLFLDRDTNPTDYWHKPHKGRRADANVAEFRNILCEFDKNSIEEQIEWLNNSRLPYSAVIHSGKKSLHVIISLSSPLRSKKEYVTLVKKLYAAIKNTGIKVDDSTSNPSRLSRYPGALRSDTGIEQKLMYVGEHVDKGILNTWIKQRWSPPAKVNKIKGNAFSADSQSTARRPDKDVTNKFISKTTNKLIKEHIHYTESRHAAFKKAAVQLRKAGYDIEEIEEMLLPAYRAVIPERNELGGILKWVELNIMPLNMDDNKNNKGV